MKNIPYKHIFFDLDHTLWDFEKNSNESLNEVYLKYALEGLGIVSREKFLARYHYHNDIYWSLFHKGKISREELRTRRFHETLNDFGISDEKLVKQLAVNYLEILPTKTNLFDDTLEILDYLYPKYHLHIITNGFEEVQFKKVKNTDIEKYFRYIITSEMAGYQKPNRLIFKYALDKTNATVLDSIFVGDSMEADMAGAKAIGMDQVFYNPNNIPHEEKVTYEIRRLVELKGIL